jgi:5-methylcytosine-specific restriction endonuclease McrA
MNHDCLVLNASGLPVSLLPLSTISWQESIKFLILEKADVLLWHDNWVIHSARWSTKVPSVMMLREFLKPKLVTRFSKVNLYLRDKGNCQYCGEFIELNQATIDHVIPTSHGGKTTWSNCSLSCSKCNAAKGDNHRIVPKIPPQKPLHYQLANTRLDFRWDIKYNAWMEYVRS